MSEYYLDIETYPKGSRPSPNDEVLTIQFQELETETGMPKGKLKILKAWESSEENILRKFHKIFMPDEPFNFVPIGMNLNYDLFLLHNRWKRIGIDVSLETLFYHHPRLDIKPILVILNEGRFKGASLDKFTKKRHSGAPIKEWYEQGEYKRIEAYIQEEAEGFIELYMLLKREIPKIKAIIESEIVGVKSYEV